jgi:hypothetical protein
MPSTTVEDVTDTPINIPSGDPFEEPMPTFDITPEFWQGQDWSFPPQRIGRTPIFGYNPPMGGRDAVAGLFDTSKTWDARQLQQQGQLPKGVAQPSTPLFPQLGVSAPQKGEENPVWARLRAVIGDARLREILGGDKDGNQAPPPRYIDFPQTTAIQGIGDMWEEVQVPRGL